MADKTPSVDGKDESRPARRRFLGAAASGVAGAAALTAPMISVAQSPVVLKMQGAWGAKDIFNEMAEQYVQRVNEMAGGRLRIDYLVAGSVVKPFEVMDATAKGVIDAAHTVAVYWYGKSKVASLFGSGPINGCNANQMLAWIHREGMPFYDELVKKLGLDVMAFFAMPMPTQPLGWFKKPIKGAADLKGLKYRTVGLAADLMQDHGLQGDAAAGRRNRAGDGARRDRRLRVQQPDLGPPLRRPGRGQELLHGQLPPGDGVLRDRFQQEEVRLAAQGPAGDPQVRRRGGLHGQLSRWRWTSIRSTCRSSRARTRSTCCARRRTCSPRSSSRGTRWSRSCPTRIRSSRRSGIRRRPGRSASATTISSTNADYEQAYEHLYGKLGF